ncbi:MAG: DUF6768 family protein [Planctomycetota bacterium]|jgi:hypothetical protein
MDNLENELKTQLDKEFDFNSNKGEEMRKLISQMFDDKLKMVKWVAWMFLLIDVVILVVAANRFFLSDSTKDMIFMAVIFLVAYESTILIKLWYWVINAKINIVKEIKQLQVQIAELTDKNPSTES